MIYYKKSPFTELQGKLPCSENPSRNSCHESKTSNPILPSQFINMDFCIFFKPVWAAYSVQWLGYTLENLEFKSLQKQQNSLFSKTSRPAPAPTQPPTPAFSGSKVASADSLDYSHLSRAKFKNQWSYTSNQSVCLLGTYWYNLILPVPPTYVHISQEVTSFLVLQRNPFIHYLPLTCTQHDIFISSSLIQLH